MKEARDRNNSSKTHTIELIQFEGEAAVRNAMAESSSMLSSRFGVEVPTAVVVSHPAVAKIINHLFELLSSEINPKLSETLNETMEEKITRTKPRLLCLHGVGSNNKATSYQIEGLKLSTSFECIFMHAQYISSSFPRLDE